MRFDPPTNLGIRPTMDRTREALFNILYNYYDWHNLIVLDLFAGSGLISLEFLSRGALLVTSVELNPKTISYLSDLKLKLGVSNWEIVHNSAENFIDFFEHRESLFDVVFLDPPYKLANKFKIIEGLFDKNVVESKGLVILEHGSQESFDFVKYFQFSKKYSNSVFSFFAIEPLT